VRVPTHISWIERARKHCSARVFLRAVWERSRWRPDEKEREIPKGARSRAALNPERRRIPNGAKSQTAFRMATRRAYRPPLPPFAALWDFALYGISRCSGLPAVRDFALFRDFAPFRSFPATCERRESVNVALTSLTRPPGTGLHASPRLHGRPT
jgi:hypothetical protein